MPVVSTRHAGISDAVIHGNTGFLVNEGDIDAMAEYLHQLLVNPELAGEMGKNAREHISINFSMDHSINRLRRIVESYVITGGKDHDAVPDPTSNQTSPLGPKSESTTYQW